MIWMFSYFLQSKQIGSSHFLRISSKITHKPIQVLTCSLTPKRRLGFGHNNYLYPQVTSRVLPTSSYMLLQRVKQPRTKLAAPVWPSPQSFSFSVLPRHIFITYTLHVLTCLCVQVDLSAFQEKKHWGYCSFAFKQLHDSSYIMLKN